MNGQVIAQGSQFSLNDVEVVVATVDIQQVRAHRSTSSRSLQAAQSESYERIRVATRLATDDPALLLELETTRVEDFHYHTPEEEIS